MYDRSADLSSPALLAFIVRNIQTGVENEESMRMISPAPNQ